MGCRKKTSFYDTGSYAPAPNVGHGDRCCAGRRMLANRLGDAVVAKITKAYTAT